MPIWIVAPKNGINYFNYFYVLHYGNTKLSYQEYLSKNRRNKEYNLSYSAKYEWINRIMPQNFDGKKYYVSSLS